MKIVRKTSERRGLAVAIALFSLGLAAKPPDRQPFRDESSVARVERTCQEARERFNKSTNDPAVAWQFGRACFDVADLARDDAPREKASEQGIAACHRALRLEPKSAPGHYYLALNLGQLARTKTLGALKLVGEMEAELKAAIELDPSFDYAGPHRSLGLLYLDAPGRPVSIGSRSKAEHHLQKAVELNPEYPGNQIALLEVYLKWDEKKTVQGKLKSVEEVLQAARKKFTGETWRSSWVEWDVRWEKIRAKVGVPANTGDSSRK